MSWPNKNRIFDYFEFETPQPPLARCSPVFQRKEALPGIVSLSLLIDFMIHSALAALLSGLCVEVFQFYLE